MKSLSLLLLLVCLASSLVGCVEKFDIISGGSSDIIVIDAVVTDADSVQFVYLRHEGEDLEHSIRQPFDDAHVHIADDKGWSADFVDVDMGREFQLKGHQFEPGTTYTMTVTVGDRTFVAVETMVALPNIKGLKFYSRQSKEETEWCPILYFEDNQPDEDNYYFFSKYFNYDRIASQNRFLYLQYLSDVGFRGDMDGIVISLGIGAREYLSSGIQWWQPYYYELYTMSKANYEYFKVLEDQLTNDGGVYKPTPASLVSNFSGHNVQGQFVAASKHVFVGYLTVDDIADR